MDDDNVFASLKRRSSSTSKAGGKSAAERKFRWSCPSAHVALLPATFALSLCPMIFGLNATKSVVIVAETKGASDSFVIAAIRPIPFQVRSGNDLAELLQTLITVFDRKDMGAGSVIALLKCSSGRFGSCLAAIKGEAMVELAASQCGLRVVRIAPQSLKKPLGCAKDQKWRDRAGELFNPDGHRLNWSKGAAGAVAVAFKVAGT